MMNWDTAKLKPEAFDRPELIRDAVVAIIRYTLCADRADWARTNEVIGPALHEFVEAEQHLRRVARKLFHSPDWTKGEKK